MPVLPLRTETKNYASVETYCSKIPIICQRVYSSKKTLCDEGLFIVLFEKKITFSLLSWWRRQQEQ